jgi:Domain of unknown function (DUF1840)
MIYKFTSKASGDVIMLGQHGDGLMRILGREPAPRGIIEVADMPGALQALQAALASVADSGQKPAAATPQPNIGGADEPAREPPVALRQRLWPFMDMLRRCQAAGQPVVWGV